MNASAPEKRRGLLRNLPQATLHLILAIVALLFLAPLGWMLATALKTPEDIIAGLGAVRWLPQQPTLENFNNVLLKVAEFPIWRWTGNSVFVSLCVTALVLVVATLAAFSYARLRWRGRDPLFGLILATMLVPGQALLIPSSLIVRYLGWFDTYLALIVPAGASAFGVFLLRQFFSEIPAELEEAAVIDGSLGVLWHVILPLAKPALAALGIFTFMGAWNAFEGPLLYTDSLEMRTLPIGIAVFQGRYTAEYGPMMAAASLAALPVVIAFLLFQRHIIKGISLTGLAGR